MGCRVPIATACVLAVLAASCSSEDAEKSTSSPPGTSQTATSAPPLDQPPTTAWEAVLDTVQDPIDVQTAIDAFSIAFGPITGATASDLEPGFSGSGSGPLRWLLGRWDELTSEQQGEVTAILAEWEADANQATLIAPQSAPTTDQLKALVNDMVVNLETLLGRSLDLAITVKVISSATELGDAWAIAVPYDSGGEQDGPATTCTITFGPQAVAQSGDDLVSLVGHEVFHCFEYALGTIAQAAKRPPWIMEGLAEWVGTSLGNGADPGGWWPDWLADHPYRSLFSRTYDAIGFYAHINDTGVELWSQIDQAILASDSGSVNAYQSLISTAATDELIDSWAAGYFRDPANAPVWDQNGAGITLDAPTIEEAMLHNEETYTLGADSFTVYFSELDLVADVVTFESPGAGLVMLADGSTERLADVHGQALCTKGSCVCPEGTPHAGTVFTDIAPGVVNIAATGHMSGSDVVVVGWSLERFCEGERCQVGTWASSAWHVPRVIAGGRDAPLIITRDGEGYIDWSQATDLFGVAQGGTDAGAELLPVKMELRGASHFFVEIKGQTARVTATAGSMGMTAYIDLGDGWFETGDTGGYSGLGKMGGEATFACAGNTLFLNSAIQFARVSTDAEIPAAAGELTPTPVADGGAPGGGGGAIPDVDPCTVLSLSEVQTLAPAASEPGVPSDFGSTFFNECSFGLAVSVQVYGPLAPSFFTDNAAVLDLTIVDIPNIGDWGVAQVNKPDAQFGIKETVLLVAAGNASGSVALVPLIDVFPGTPQYQALVELLALALSRI